MVSFPLSLLEAQAGFFSGIYCEDLLGLLEEKSTKVWGFPQWMGPPEVFLSQTCPHWALSNSSITVQAFLPQHWFLPRFQLVTFCSGKLWFSVLACGSLLFWEQFALRFEEVLFHVQLFTSCLDGMATLKLFTCQTGNWKFLLRPFQISLSNDS